MITKILIILGLSILSGIFYRIGGAGARWVRIWGCPTIDILLLTIMFGWNWWLLLCWGLEIPSMTTYHKWLNSYFNKPKTDVYWFNFAAQGICVCLSSLPYVWVLGLWLGFGIRLIVLPAILAVWSLITNDEIIGEGGRGFWVTATLPLLKI